MTDDNKIPITKEAYDNLIISNKLASISTKDLFNAKLWYDDFKKWVLNSEEYIGDGHYLINTRGRIYNTDSDTPVTDEQVYGFNQEQIEELENGEYYPSISIPEDEYFYQIIHPVYLKEELGKFDIGITIKDNRPTTLFYHGEGFTEVIDQGTVSWEGFPPEVRKESIILESLMGSALGFLGKGEIHRLEYCSNDTWTMPIPVVIFDLPYEDWLINWLLPEASEDNDTIQKKDDNPERKDLNDWKEQVKDRDNVCIVCGDEKHLECHHVYPFGLYPKLRDDVNNGVVLCRWCHRRYHSHYGKEERVNPSTLMQFVQRFGTGATQSHVTTVEHVEQVLKDDGHMNKKEKIDQIYQIVKKCNQDDKYCTRADLLKDSTIPIQELAELLKGMIENSMISEITKGNYRIL
jgi:hypothetical protein